MTATAGATMLTGLVQQPTPIPAGADDPAGVAAEGADDAPPPIVREEQQLLDVVLRKLDGGGPRKARIQVDDASALIELRDALAEAKPEDQGSILEQMHRIEALSKQRGKGDTPPVDRKSPYFGHLRLEESGKRRDVLIGARSFVEPGGGVQIVDWRNAPVSRLFYRYEEGDAYEERLGDKLVEGEILARRTVAIVDAELRRVAAPQGTFSRDLRTGPVARGGDAAGARCRSRATAARVVVVPRGEARAPALPPPPRRRRRAASWASTTPATRRPDRHLPAIAALIDPRQFELITQPSSGLIAIQGSAGSGKTTIGLHRIAYLAFADPRRFRPEKMLVIVYQRALAAYVSRVLPSLDVEGVPVMTFAGWADAARRAAVPLAGGRAHRRDAAAGDARQGARRDAADHRRSPGGAGRLVPGAAADASWRARPTRHAVLAFWDGTSGPADGRVTALAQWVRDGKLDPGDAQRAREHRAHAARAHARRGRRVGGAAHRSRGAGRRASPATRPGCSRPASSTTSTAGASRAIACARRGRGDERRRDVRARRRGRRAAAAHLPAPARPASRDGRQGRARLRAPDGRRGAGLLAAGAGGAAGRDVSAQRSVTLAGDTAQAIAPEHGFSNWTELLDFLRHRARARRAAARQLPLDARDRRRRRARAGAADGRRPAGGAARGRARRVVPVRVGGRVRRVPVARAQGAGARRARRVGGAAGAPPRAGARLLRGAGARRGADAAPGRRPGLLVHRRASTSPTCASRRASSSTSSSCSTSTTPRTPRPTTRAACCTSR